MMMTWSSRSRRQLPTQRSATPFCHGLRKAVRNGTLPIAFTDETTSLPNFASRSNSRNLCSVVADYKGAIQAAQGEVWHRKQVHGCDGLTFLRSHRAAIAGRDLEF